MNDHQFQHYRVWLTETAIAEAYVVVRARSAEEAERVARQAVFQGEAEDEPAFTRVNALDTGVYVEGETDGAADYDADDFPDEEGDGD